MGLILGYFNTISREISVLNGVSFSCQSSTDCCRKHKIPVTESEISLLLDHDLEADQILESLSPILIPTKDNSVQKVYFLKKKPFSQECIFLHGTLCSIHDIKPIACQLYPFDYELEQDQIIIMIHRDSVCKNVQTSITKPLESEVHIQHIIRQLEFMADLQ